MQQIPQLVQELGVARLTNAVYVGTMKFTLDEVREFINSPYFTEEQPVPEMLKKQFIDFANAFNVVDDAYALTQRSAITDEIAALDKEGDQLVYAVKGIVEAAQRMTFDTERVQRANYYAEFLKKYRIDPTENMISEWSKVQQACAEVEQDFKLVQAGKDLGITAAMDRLKVIADAIRQKITERSAQLPEAQQMKNARAAMDPEYRALILILNSFAVTASDQDIYEKIIKTLNNNINYVRVHAMSKSTPAADGGGEEQPDDESVNPEPTQQ